MHIDSLQYIQFYPTLKCNSFCSFCFNRGIKHLEDISVNNFKSLLSIFSDIGIKELDILGGEPTLHPYFDKLIDLSYKNKLKVNISSNGSNINLLKSVSDKYNDNQIKIGISLNSNPIRRELHEYIIKYKPLLKTVSSNLQLIPKAIKKYLYLPGIKFYLIFMDILYKDDLENCLSFYDYFKEVNFLKNFYEHIYGVFCSGFIPDIESYPVLQYVRCPAGTTKLSVLPDGSVYPCYLFFRYEEFKLGNIFVDDFKKIWENPVLDFFRIFEKNNCVNTKCNLFSACHGGCPAISFMIYGSLNSSDPRCVKQLS
ncbi:MAG: SPASM domain-containing protein [Thermodesulfovibrionales bacterium]